ncbi:LacI family DNA-binding transcriptional regulator [Synoicihabitans lomoniglobus]|uniref:LacI family DNA-binding transcriptional regulator n=1 Tax=Synoicihabitans lomoniglobus TaxID=2909285 RepID=A0AAF0CN14_9BACT|nr:LacI family transcriptional regulator [Opitutaceae bacterium LMO-M01]WED63830.1 LacI family DNA-binding transcriptional regulator [Opitutaceae bacterium LMO-M01]
MPLTQAHAKRVTIKDVAREAGVHFTTVSLALRDHGSIPERTRARIRTIAENLGYQKNAVFSALTQFHVNGSTAAATPRIAFVANRTFNDATSFHPHLRSFYDGARHQAGVLGYELETIIVAQDRHDSRSLERYLRSHNISGILIASFEPGYDTLSLNWDDYAIVKIDSMHMSPEAVIVANDHRQDIRTTYRQLARRGYRRIGLAVGRADEESTQHRFSAGYLIERGEMMPGDEHNIPPLLFPFNPTREQAVSLLRSWVKHHQLDAVISHHSHIDELLHEAGLRVPRDIACACLCIRDDNTHLTGVRPNNYMIGVKAVSQLATQIRIGERGIPEFSPQTYVRSEWQEGNSAPGGN